MNNNQTIDGVPRDCMMRLTPEAHSVMLGMVEHCLNIRACMGMDEGFKDFDTEEEHDFVKELRALLDAPAKPEPSCIGDLERFESDGEDFVKVCDVIDMLGNLKAAQPQGEPVAVVLPARADAMAGSHDHQSGWNACLDEVARLNAKS